MVTKINKSEFELMLARIKSIPIMRNIVAKDSVFGNYIIDCLPFSIKQSERDFVDFSIEFLTLQRDLLLTKNYRYSKEVETTNLTTISYLNALLLTQIFWINHYKMFMFFSRYFCNNLSSGYCLEVPIGTGIFAKYFKEKNLHWSVFGCDKSIIAVNYSKLVLSNTDVVVFQEDVFSLKKVSFNKIICGELLEHVEDPDLLLRKLHSLLAFDGSIYLTTAIYAAAIDHIYLFTSVQQVRKLLNKYFVITHELILPVFKEHFMSQSNVPLNYACVLHRR